jgi:hypothetical protein
MSGTVIVAAPTPTPTVPPTATPTPGGPLPAIPDLGISGRIGLAMALAGVALLLLLSIRSR